MNYYEFRNKVSPKNYDFNTFNKYYALFKKCSNFYHVVVHELANESFIAMLNENIIAFGYYEYGSYNHVHYFIWSKEQFKSSRGIQSEPIKNEQHRNFIEYKIIYGMHDYYCSVKFGFPSLQFLSQKIILNNLSCLQGINQLTIPKKLKNNLFQQGKSYYNFPEWDGKTVKKNINICEIDSVYDKHFVIRYQNTKYIYSDPLFLVYNYFVYDHYKVYKLCQNCIHFELEKEDFRRNYMLCFHTHVDVNKFVTNFENWCQACKQVPLFQILNEKEVYRQYEFDTTGKDTIHLIVKQAIFENGIFVDSLFHTRGDIISTYIY